jgi:hypothetical protein
LLILPLFAAAGWPRADETNGSTFFEFDVGDDQQALPETVAEKKVAVLTQRVVGIRDGQDPFESRPAERAA